jgi:hypothetical protein
MVGITGPAILSTRVFALLFLLTSSVASVAGKRSGHHEQPIASLRNEDVGLDAENDLDDVPEECQGEEDANKLERCIEGYNLKQALLAQFNLENIPKECEKEDANKLEDCMTNWDLGQVILGLSDTKIPPECEGLEKLDKLVKCMEQNTLSPTSQPSGAPSTMSPTKLPTKSPTQHHSAQDLTQPPSEEFVFTTSSLKDVILDIGEFVMSLTTYSQTSREAITNDFLSRQYELKAARQHLREVYEDVYSIPVSSVDLEFIDSGVTTLSKSDSMIRHSIFSGNVTFIEDATNVMPTVAQLESDTLEAFSGPQKEEFIKIYHFLATGNPYFGVKYRYDVNVRKLINNNINNINKGEGEVGNIAAQELQGMGGTGNDAVGTSGMFIGLMIVLAFVVVGTMFGLVVLVRRRKLDRVPSSQEISYDDGFDVEEVNVTGSKVGSDVSLSPIQMVEDVSRHSSENISHLGIDLSVASDDDEKSKDVDDIGEIVSSSWNLDDLRQENAYIDVELEIGSQ